MGRVLFVGIGVVVGLLIAVLVHLAAPDDAQPVATTSPDVTALRDRVAVLEGLLKHVSRVEDDLFITGANLHLVNGTGSTAGEPNGLGNIVIGYNESREQEGRERSDARTGSHMLVVGSGLNYTSHGGIVAGYGNTTSGPYASVTGGMLGTAEGPHASVTGGVGNRALGHASVVSGGGSGVASGKYSAISGGTHNRAEGLNSSIAGGERNLAGADCASVLGGIKNRAMGGHSSVSGGQSGKALGFASSVGGGRANRAEGRCATVSGGAAHDARESDEYAPVIGSR